MKAAILATFPRWTNRKKVNGSIFLQEKLITFIRDELISDPDAEITADTPLISSGLMDSFALVTLQAFIEKELGVKVPAPRITVDSFNTIARMISIIDLHR